MGLATEMKSLSKDLLASFRQRISENEELVNDVQKTLDGFRKDQNEMAAMLNANALTLRKNLANGEKERLGAFNDLMSGIHTTVSSIQKEVVEIQKSTFKMIHEFATDRSEMAEDLNESFALGRAERMENDKTRIKEFDFLMKIINKDITSINNDVSAIFKNTNHTLDKFEKDHLNMSVELKAELGKNLKDRVEYTRSLLKGFQKKLTEISKENQKMAQNLRKDLANGEKVRIGDYNDIMKGIHTSIKGIQKEVTGIQKYTSGMLGDLLNNREQASTEWIKMQETMTQIRKPKPAMEATKKAAKHDSKKEVPAKKVTKTKKAAKYDLKKEVPVKKLAKTKKELKITDPVTTESKVLDFITKHPSGVRISEMEEPLGETRMKLGFIAKKLLDEGKVLKIDTVYFPNIRHEG
jgi:mRNA-degrading endonuclease RelE of RelBE toxin-antitoxin system